LSIILGIDPGSHITGFGVLRTQNSQKQRGSFNVEHVSHGVIMLPKNADLATRLAELSLGMEQILKKYKPQHVVIEKIFLGRNPDSAFKLGHARGVIMSLAARDGATVHEYATRVVKKGIAGNGSADKLQVQLMVQRILKLPKIEKIDASDALALALYYAQCVNVNESWDRIKSREVTL